MHQTTRHLVLFYTSQGQLMSTLIAVYIFAVQRMTEQLQVVGISMVLFQLV